ncbi:MAG TPA: hypothetical protein VM141_02430 [Planctomycetota bacterium]|nr:hypothetical protein [Planctomycetota bacterium]
MPQEETKDLRVLAAGAHPDDIEIMMAGTLRGWTNGCRAARAM